METGLANKIKLAVEEAVTNVIDYAYPNGTEGNINITIEADESRVRFILSDSGAEFDPTGVSKADTTLTVDERPIGGLGVFLVRNLMDSINYERVDGKNVLRMEKRFRWEEMLSEIQFFLYYLRINTISLLHYLYICTDFPK